MALLGACATQQSSSPGPHGHETRTEQPAETPPLPAQNVRYGRYTLVNAEPTAEQLDLLAQIIEVSIPPGLNPTVQDAMRHVLQRSGYALCPVSSAVKVLFTRPLPATHYRLGPLTLRNALEVLAGPAWQLLADDIGRTVCFRQRGLGSGAMEARS
ncbi:PilL N-terminal domain-containing protein [Pseudomonas sp. GD03721]|nr:MULTISPECIES: PilL N-terminal domain-containing protein [unclassified Pseudomonas]MDH1440371.1 PilL N-terminal domain-containing protein [Pseudomonas sp. GD03722]WGG03779.1 PilL N-terminal domain-containing protein [Pseudomonas sp. GD03721]WGG07947.1 PilL N-terminal domain-containing protein [Pseudomonas sp. GD03919]